MALPGYDGDRGDGGADWQQRRHSCDGGGDGGAGWLRRLRSYGGGVWSSDGAC
jgi:hypothetical protein